MLYVLNRNDDRKPMYDSRSARSLVDTGLLDAWPKVDRSKVDLSHMADGLTPPTNTWFSGMALQKDPEPVFSYPNSFRPTGDGFEFGLPTVSATSETISGPHTADVSVAIDGAVNYKITDYDELTVQLTYYSADAQEKAVVRLATGVPYVFVTVKNGASLDYGERGNKRGQSYELPRGGAMYGVRSESDNSSFFSVPQKDAFDELSKYALHTVTGGSAEYSSGQSRSETTLRYQTVSDQPTLIARLPHQQFDTDTVTDVRYESILGAMTTTAGTILTFSVPTVNTDETLPIESLSDEQKQELREQLIRDVGSLPKERNDTYFGGKQLQRTAQLLLIADQLGQDTQRDMLKRQLSSRLSDWLRTNGAFEYDDKAKTILGKETSFGADTEVNDHHFHYGYIVYAAAVLAKFDESFLREYSAAVDLLVADIANYKPDEPLIQRRNYDPYFGHSWASGTAPFKDGNNQESTSEAINAWIGVKLWGTRTGNEDLSAQAEWMLSNETATAKQYWLTKPNIPGYISPFVSIVWGGKREYKTFFSDESNAKLAILLLPLSPAMRDYASLSASMFENVDTTAQYGDYLLMAQPGAAIEQARALPDASLDDGNSRTYLYAYMMTKK